MATIATTTNANPFQYPGMTLLARNPSINRYICLVKGSTADNYLFYRSTDTGASWSLMATVVRTNLVDVGQIFLDGYGWLIWAYRTNESSQDRIYVRMINTTSSAVQPEVLLANPGNGGSVGSYYSGIDVKSFYNVGQAVHYIAVAVGTNIGGNQGVTILGATAGGGDPPVSANSIISGTQQWLHAGAAGRVGPSMDTQHSGDGYFGTPNLWVVYGRTQCKLVKLSWTGNGWIGPASETLIYANINAQDQMCARWTKNRLFIAIPDPITTTQVLLFERDSGNSTTTTRPSAVHPTGTVRSVTIAYNDAEDVRAWAVGTSTGVLYQADWTKATSIWSAWASTGLPTILGAGADNYGAKRSTYGDARWGLYTAVSGAPNTLTYTPLQQSYAPNTPGWASPANGAAADVALPLTLTWIYRDSDPGDFQSAYAVSRQIGTGALNYWRASDNTWQVAEVKNTSSTSSITIPASWALASDATYTFKAKVWDTDNNFSGYSAGLMVIPSTPVNPVITSPTAAQVISTDHVTVVWTAAEQTQYRVVLNIQAGAQVYDSGWIGDSVSRSFLIPYTLATGTAWTITLYTANVEGLASAAQTRNFSVNFTPPATPTLVISLPANLGTIRASITNPTPGGAQPAVATQDLYRRPVGSTVQVRVATGLPNGPISYDDWQAISGISYEYQVLTIGVNGASTTSAWTA